MLSPSRVRVDGVDVSRSTPIYSCYEGDTKIAYYNFLNTITNEETVEEIAISELDAYKEANPHMHQLLSTGVGISYSGYGVQVDTDFNSRMKEIKKAYPRSTINTYATKRQRKL